jgi:hypothetical protein
MGWSYRMQQILQLWARSVAPSTALTLIHELPGSQTIAPLQAAGFLYATGDRRPSMWH